MEIEISATSALVLNWTNNHIWKTKEAIEYMDEIDLSEGDSILKLFSDEENYMHTQSVTNRKCFMRQSAVNFLKKCKAKKISGQVIILAAGIAPLSIELASLFPHSAIFDVDKFLMQEKEMDIRKMFKDKLSNIQFVKSDITNIAELESRLLKNGWKPDEKTLLIMEGITYYLKEVDLKYILEYFCNKNTSLACDFLLNYDDIDESTRKFGLDVFGKIKESVGLDFVESYAPEYFMNMLSEIGFKNPKRVQMTDVQKERTGWPEPYRFPESGWITLVKTGM